MDRESNENHELHQHCEAWFRWCITRRYFIRPGAKNILARMQPSKVMQPPDAILSNDLSFMNMAIHALADMGDPDAECFAKFYFDRVKNIKKVAADMGIGTRTFYDRKNRFAKKAKSMARSIKVAHESAFEVEPDAVLID